MSMIFPGMDPYLEDPPVWEGFHSTFVIYLRDHLQPQIRPRYIASVGRRDFVEPLAGESRSIIPDVWVRRRQRPDPEAGVAVLEVDEPDVVEVPGLEVRQPFIEILDRQSGLRVVTVIEVVSPANKYAGPGRELYLTKQREVRQSDAHLVEIDLLRNGPHVLIVPEWTARGRHRYDYLVCVNRASGLRDKFELYPTRLLDQLPTIGVPLAGSDADAPLDLQAVLAYTYEQGSYSEQLRYDQPCRPLLSPADQQWANERIAQARPAASA